MGWTFTNTIYPTTPKKWLDEEIKTWWDDAEILATSFKANTYYAAIRKKKKDGNYVTFALICLTSQRPNEIGYKDMDETCGPMRYDCGKKVLEALQKYASEAPDNEYSREWRAECLKRLVKPAKLENGDVIKMNQPIKFQNGLSESVFRILKFGRKVRFEPRNSLFSGYCYIDNRTLNEIGFEKI